MDIALVLAITTAVVALATLIFAFLTWRIEQSSLKISQRTFSKEVAKGKLLHFKNELEEIADKSKKYEGRFRDKNLGIWNTAAMAHELYDCGIMLIQTGYFLPVRFIDMILEKNFFKNNAKIEKLIGEIETLIDKLG